MQRHWANSGVCQRLAVHTLNQQAGPGTCGSLVANLLRRNPVGCCAGLGSGLAACVHVVVLQCRG